MQKREGKLDQENLLCGGVTRLRHDVSTNSVYQSKNCCAWAWAEGQNSLPRVARSRLPSFPSRRVVLDLSSLGAHNRWASTSILNRAQKSCACALAQSARRRGEGDAGSVASRSRAVPIRGHVGLPGVSDRAFYAAFSVIFLVFRLLPPPPTSHALSGPAFFCVVPPPLARPEFRSQFGSGAGPSHSAGHYLL